MSEWVPLHIRLDTSLQNSILTPAKLVARLEECGYPGGAVTDTASISGIPTFFKTMKKAGRKGVAGVELNLVQDASIKTVESSRWSRICLLSKNKTGWKNLIRTVSESNKTEFFYHRPRLDLERLRPFVSDWVAFSGGPGSTLANCLFEDPRLAYSLSSYDDVKALVRKDWKESALKEIARHQEIFGKDNFFLSIQLLDAETTPANLIAAKIFRSLSAKTGARCLAVASCHYPTMEDARDHRVLVCSSLKTTMTEVKKKADSGEDFSLGVFFRSNRYHIPTLEEMRSLHPEDELRCSVDIFNGCEEYDLFNKPMVPTFPCENPDELLKSLCRAGWKKRLAGRVTDTKTYVDRVHYELDVLKQAGFQHYFLVVEDYVRYAREKLDALVDGRGSASGSLVSFLLGITDPDPIKFNIEFFRFINPGRITQGNYKIPDIDLDFPSAIREQVVDYCSQKYGKERVMPICTFGVAAGRSALKDVLRVNNRLSFDEMNSVTKFVPDKAQVADELQEMMEETGEGSLIRWALENRAKYLQEWCFIGEDGELDGPLAPDFAQAMRIEWTKKTLGKHAGGVIICPEPITDYAPIIRASSEEGHVVGFDMYTSEEVGLAKFDFLGQTSLQRMKDARNIIRTGKC